MRKLVMVMIVSGLLSLTGCIRQFDVQQGNELDPAVVKQLKPGMSKAEVTDLLGEPVLVNVFRSDRLNYVYTLKSGKQPTTIKKLTVYFVHDNLQKVTS